MNRSQKIIIVAALILLLAGCHSKITAGEVIKKEFVPAHVTYDITPIMLIVDGPKYVFIPQRVNHSGSWYITIQQIGNDDEPETATYEVDESVFNRTEIGSWFDYQEGHYD